MHVHGSLTLAQNKPLYLTFWVTSCCQDWREKGCKRLGRGQGSGYSLATEYLPSIREALTSILSIKKAKQKKTNQAKQMKTKKIIHPFQNHTISHSKNESPWKPFLVCLQYFPCQRNFKMLYNSRRFFTPFPTPIASPGSHQCLWAHFFPSAWSRLLSPYWRCSSFTSLAVLVTVLLTAELLPWAAPTLAFPNRLPEWALLWPPGWFRYPYSSLCYTTLECLIIVLIFSSVIGITIGVTH